MELRTGRCTHGICCRNMSVRSEKRQKSKFANLFMHCAMQILRIMPECHEDCSCFIFRERDDTAIWFRHFTPVFQCKFPNKICRGKTHRSSLQGTQVKCLPTDSQQGPLPAAELQMPIACLQPRSVHLYM